MALDARAWKSPCFVERYLFAFASVLVRPFLMPAAATLFLGDGLAPFDGAFVPFDERTAGDGCATRFAPFRFAAARANSMRDFGRTRRR